jgi:hypothetical protein
MMTGKSTAIHYEDWKNLGLLILTYVKHSRTEMITRECLQNMVMKWKSKLETVMKMIMALAQENLNSFLFQENIQKLSQKEVEPLTLQNSCCLKIGLPLYIQEILKLHQHQILTIQNYFCTKIGNQVKKLLQA